MDGHRGRGRPNRGNPNRGRGNWRRRSPSAGDAAAVPPVRAEYGGAYNRNEHANERRNQGHLNNPRGGRSPNPNGQRSRFGFKKMEQILEKKPEEALLEVVSLREDILKYINTDVSNDCIVLLVKLFANILEVNFRNNIADVLRIFINPTFANKLETFISRLTIQNVHEKRMNKCFWNDMNSFWTNLNIVCNGLIEIIPKKATQFLQPVLRLITINLPHIRNDNGASASDEVMQSFENLQLKMVQLIEKEMKAPERQNRNGQYEEEVEPLDDYRDISIYPSSEELLARYSHGIRKNKIEGGYTDVEQYLDIQFRLLREDFVAPLRHGIAEHLTNKKDKRGSNIKIYKDAVCLCKKLVNSEIGLVIQVFKRGQLRNVERTKRLMFGSLVLFTDDNFQTMIFGKVIDRDITYLKKGQVVVSLHNDADLVFNKTYMMVECLVYFEPYYQVLKALQNMRPDRFPMQRYLVDVKNEMVRPGYIALHDRLEFTKIIRSNLEDEDEDALELKEKYHLPMYDVNYGWPDSQTMEFNPAQYNAFKAAVTNQFCIIQGPPGTGKTYMGLKIAKLLIENKDKWSEQGPMLVICFTNHALDQFLEGLVEATEKIVRVGGQSKNEKLKEFNLINHRRRYIRNVKALLTKRDALRAQKLLLTGMNSEYNKTVEIEGIPDLFKDRGFGKIDPEFEDSWFNKSNSELILSWLMDEALTWNVNVEENPTEEEEEELEEFDLLNQKGKHGLELDDEEENAVANKEVELLISLPVINKKIKQLTDSMRKMNQNTDYYFQTQRELQTLTQQKEYLKHHLETLKDFDNFRKPLFVNLNNPYLMRYQDRWGLVRCWMNRYRVHLRELIEAAEERYRILFIEYEEVKEMYDAIYMRTCDVIGMTTTGAARLQSTLMTLKCPIVIVEEAAEVLEAHIVAALTEKCQHLILIGDHKQLRPSTADYNIEKRYNLGISLFERMILNGFNSNTLNIQHRMRPEISALVCPSIYPTLENHASVLNFHPIRGVEKSLFFITHDKLEKESSDQSKENSFEATYIIMLANYLVLNNYEPEKITILSAYSGQFFLLLKERKLYPRLQNVKITILDNYQGEENDIILLSLVRNNPEGKIGFLKLENRVCVALSRAKRGMYIMGNMNLLSNNSEIWPKIKTVLEASGSLGPALPLKCYNHPDNLTLVANIEDFNQVPEGGCTLICDKLRNCGHICSLMCHVLPHSNYNCYEPCIKILCDFNHQCPKLCYEDCGECMVPKMEKLPCGHVHQIPCHKNGADVKCETIVDVTLRCGHKNHKQCSTDIKNCICKHKCEARIEPCGHACRFECHIDQDPDHLLYECMKKCARPNANCSMPENPSHKCEKKCCEKCSPCEIVVPKKRTICPHLYNVKCSEDVDLIACNKPCRKLMECGHACKLKCKETCGNCRVEVKKVIEECGHEVKITCSKVPTRKDCKKDCNVTLKCGHKCTYKCNIDCYKNPCKELVQLQNRTSPCGHVLTVPCHSIQTFTDEDALNNCKEKCPAILKCGHQCPGTCGKCHQGRLHVSCTQKCNTTLVCDHECNTPCRSMCQPCTRPCMYRCVHSKCKQKCGNICTPCKEKCKRKCPHVVCTKFCSDYCEVEPCTQPCTKKLMCGHNCIGYCGDECPPKCLICDEEEVKEIFFGTEDEEDARFVYLKECGHILEGSSLDQWFEDNSNSESVKIMVCPKCKTPLKTTIRYGNYIKMALKKLNAVKRKFEGNKQRNAIEHEGLKTKSTHIYVKYGEKINSIKFIASNWINILGKYPNEPLIKDCKSKFDILEDLCEAYASAKVTKVEGRTILNKSLKFLLNYLENLINVSEQTVNDYPLEMKRFSRIIQLCEIIESAKMEYRNLQEYTNCQKVLFSVKRFSDEEDQLAGGLLTKFNDKTRSGLNITEKERREIVAAMGMTKGHWFTCPNGHVYAIGDCGGAMVTSRCNECGAAIGGGNHQLLPTNSFAGEMDGARHPAWSEMANLGNYNNL